MKKEILGTVIKLALSALVALGIFIVFIYPKTKDSSSIINEVHGTKDSNSIIKKVHNTTSSKSGNIKDSNNDQQKDDLPNPVNIENRISTIADVTNSYLNSNFDVKQHTDIMNMLKDLRDQKNILNSQKQYINSLISKLDKKQEDYFKSNAIAKKNAAKNETKSLQNNSIKKNPNRTVLIVDTLKKAN